MDAVTLALIKSMAGNGGGGSLPSVTSADNGKVLAVKDGVWAAGELNGNGRYVQISAIKVNGAYTVTTQLTSAEVVNAYLNGYVFHLVIGGYTSYMQVLLAGSAFLLFKAVLQTQETVIVQINGLDEENAAINIEPYPNKFIVTLTPTALDYSGTMDKTVAEINAAYEAGQEIVFKLQTSASSYIEVPVQLVGHSTAVAYPSFEASAVQRVDNVQVFAYTGATDDGTNQTYSTKVYSLTPAS